MRLRTLCLGLLLNLAALSAGAAQPINYDLDYRVDFYRPSGNGDPAQLLSAEVLVIPVGGEGSVILPGGVAGYAVCDHTGDDDVGPQAMYLENIVGLFVLPREIENRELNTRVEVVAKVNAPAAKGYERCEAQASGLYHWHVERELKLAPGERVALAGPAGWIVEIRRVAAP